jgi:hypothetical protein
MSDLSVTAANVDPADNAIIINGTAGATITAGQSIYKDSTDNKIKLADADSSLATAAAVGISLNGASDDQPIQYQSSGDIDIGATLTVGEIYLVSDTAGRIAPEADVGSGGWVTILGVATATDNLKMGLFASSAQVP